MDPSSKPQGIDGPPAWRTAWIVLGILSISFGSPLLIVVGMKPIQEALGTDRSTVALAGSFAWFGTAAGGILMGWLADKIGVRTTLAFGAIMVACGLALSSLGPIWALYVGHGLMLGLLGNGAIYAPLLVYVSRWFERRRGTAIALISSGQYIAGVVWPALFERGFSAWGWQNVMLGYAVVIAAVILPATLLLKPLPIAAVPHPTRGGRAAQGHRIAGIHPTVAQVMLCIAGFFCCIPMAVPQAHLVAFCSDIGIVAARGAMMLSVMLAAAFVSRQLWGVLADRIGGLRTVLVGAICQAICISGFLLTQDETGLFFVAAAFGLGFSGIIPAYSVAVRDLFSASQASWRIPLTLSTAQAGMAFGAWFAGRLYDHYGTYAPAFGSGIAFNVLNILIIGSLVLLLAGARRKPA
ncbi:MAG: MFS transporter [Alphaproteobacteria bacterium]|nr:MFS transporter [Alphaproteobacteria bacterium]MCW5743692.1 MFS transporter [Alphaproteobacteria bacterium]